MSLYFFNKPQSMVSRPKHTQFLLTLLNFLPGKLTVTICQGPAVLHEKEHIFVPWRAGKKSH